MEEQDLDMAFRVAHANYLETESTLKGMLQILCTEEKISFETMEVLEQKIKDLHRWADEQEIALRKQIQKLEVEG